MELFLDWGMIQWVVDVLIIPRFCFHHAECYRAIVVPLLTHITFDEAEACIGHTSTHAHYRVKALKATNAVDFMNHHKRLIFAMMKNSPEELETYRLQPDTGGCTE